MRFPKMAVALLLLAVAFATGCSQSASQGLDMGGEDGKQIAELVEQLNDDGGRAKKAKEIFVDASGKESKNYGAFSFNLKGKPNVSGTTATATIVIEKLAGGAPTEKDWEFVKEGDKWKIKSAPLP